MAIMRWLFSKLFIIVGISFLVFFIWIPLGIPDTPFEVIVPITFITLFAELIALAIPQRRKQQ